MYLLEFVANHGTTSTYVKILFVIHQAFDKDFNDCKSLVSPALTKKQKKQIHDNMEKSKLAKMKYTLEDIKEVNPVRKLIITNQHLS